MAEYTPLMSTPPEEYEIETKTRVQELSPRFTQLFSLLVAFMAIAAAAAFHLSVLATYETQQLLRPKDVESTLRMVRPSPNLEKGHAIMRENKFKFPRMVFPMFIVRANAAAPDQVYESGSSVVLSETDSMIYHWRANSSWPKCYLTAWVSSSEELIAGHKSYTSDGDVTALEIWNLSTPANRNSLETMSWNMRPVRLSLLGSVNFTSRETQNQLGHLDGQEIRAPTPRFDCLGVTEITVEVVCKTCRLEFDQVFSMPPLGFELMQLA
ncbi:hypothetical protein K438DRAFT_1954939 [Mycena galopus ATCC 62051]|nr:hypothetical protein K438DRAFT_1954939 [Mycena galopus ATCC 62051]